MSVQVALYVRDYRTKRCKSVSVSINVTSLEDAYEHGLPLLVHRISTGNYSLRSRNVIIDPVSGQIKTVKTNQQPLITKKAVDNMAAGERKYRAQHGLPEMAPGESVREVLGDGVVPDFPTPADLTGRDRRRKTPRPRSGWADFADDPQFIEPEPQPIPEKPMPPKNRKIATPLPKRVPGKLIPPKPPTVTAKSPRAPAGSVPLPDYGHMDDRAPVNLEYLGVPRRKPEPAVVAGMRGDGLIVRSRAKAKPEPVFELPDYGEMP